MNLIKLKMEDFRVYHGVHVVEFSNNIDKNVTIVHGENGIGKTTMLNAIKWCLYAKAPDFNANGKPRKLLNNITNKINENRKFSVEIEFQEGDETYIAIREGFQSTNLGVAYEGNERGLTLLKVDNTGSSNTIPNPQNIINKILPEQLSDYFLFAGETYSDLDASGTSYKKAVRDILGFTLSELAVNDLENIEKKNKTKLNKLLRHDTTTSNLTENIVTLENEIQILQNESDAIGLDIKGYDKEIKEYNTQIRESKHHKAEELQKQKEEKIKSLNHENSNLQDYESQKQSLISKFGYAIFGNSLVEKMSWMKDDKNQNEIPGDIFDTLINRLLSEGKCLCHTPLVKGTDEYKNVELRLETAATSELNDRVRSALSFRERIEGRSTEFIEEEERIENALTTTRELITSYENARDDLTEDLKALKSKDITKTLALEETAQKNRNDALKMQSLKDVLITGKTTEKNKLTRQRDVIPSGSKEVERRKKTNKTIELVMERINSKQKKQEEDARQEIELYVQKNIDQVLRKQFHVKVDENYRLISTYKGDESEDEDQTGKGQELLTNLSFFSALIQYSKKRLHENDDTYLFGAGTVAPFVIDAPFAQMDKKYQKATLKFLPPQSHQLILFLSTGQWRQEYEKIIGDRIGKRYYLLNHVPKHFEAEEDEDDQLVINGKKYALNINDGISDVFPHTTITKI